MHRKLFVVAFGLAIIAALGSLPQRASADDETTDTAIKIQAPLDATDCSGTPPTISALGLTIDISAATIEAAAADTPAPQVVDGGCFA